MTEETNVPDSDNIDLDLRTPTDEPTGDEDPLAHITSFDQLPTSVLQGVHLNFYTERLRWQGMRHMRRFAERLVESSGSYSDLCVGPQEFRAFIGATPGPQSHGWLDKHGVPPLSDIDQTLQELDLDVQNFLQQLSEENLLALPLEHLRHAFNLSEDELQLLVAAAAPHINESIMRFMTVAWADFAVRLPTVSFIAHLVSNDPEHYVELVERLSDRGNLVKLRLVVPQEHTRWQRNTPRLHAPLNVDQRVIDTITAAPLEENIPPHFIYHGEAPPMNRLVLNNAFTKTFATALTSSAPRVLLVGPQHSGRRTLTTALSRNVLDRATLEIDLPLLLTTSSDQPLHIRVAEALREAQLLNTTLLIRFDDIPNREQLRTLLHGHTRQLSSLFSAFPGPVVATAPTQDRLLIDLLASPIELPFPPLSFKEQAHVWSRALKGSMPSQRIKPIAETFSSNYQMPIGSIFRAVQHAREERLNLGQNPKDLQSHDLLNQIRKAFDHNLGALADVTVVQTQLRDVVLPAKIRDQVHEVLHYAKFAHTVFDEWGFRQRSPYGNSLSVLLSGPPGTGKTFLAGALANELGKVLYKVDISRIVDKYIGETEKNLGRVFDEAAKAQAVLLFDEADSLFSKRTEVKSSNDRHANLEVNYLLQRLEAYDGVSILTTNFERSIDPAFMRRIRFGISFPLPEASERARLWRQLVPPNAPLEPNMDWELLGECFEMSGGHIRNATLRAAIRCAARSKPITLAALLHAGAAEAREMGILVRLDFELPEEV